jgi:hypothetical protein
LNRTGLVGPMFIRIPKARPKNNALRIDSTEIHIAKFRNAKRHRVLNAATRFLEDASSQVLHQPLREEQI